MNTKKMKKKWLYFGFVCILFAVLTVGALAEESNVENLDGIIQQGSDDNLILSEEEFSEITRNTSRDDAAERLMVVLKACSLQGDVSYYWGGKSSVIGWDERWGTPSYVISEGSSSTGTLRAFGLDCSGYVNWVFNNAVKKDITFKIGDGSTNQWENSSAVNWRDAQVGDLAFFYDPTVTSIINHVGIVVGQNENNELLVAHCSSSYDNVVITEAQSAGFKYIRTPDIYKDQDFITRAVQQAAVDKYFLRMLQSESADQEYAEAEETVETEESADQIYRATSSFKN